MVRAVVAQGSHQSSILVMGADLQPFKKTVTCDLRCCCPGFAQNPTSLILGLTIHKRLPQPRSGMPHTHYHCYCGGFVGDRGPGVSLVAPQSLQRAEIFMVLFVAWLWHLSDARRELSWGTAWFFLTNWAPDSSCAPLCFPSKPAVIAQVCQKSVPYSGGGKGEKTDFMLLCWVDKCSLMKGATSSAAHSQPQRAQPHTECEGLQVSHACPWSNRGVPALWETC